jgi:hypothetical protein
MGVWAGPFLVATVLLAAAGVTKVWDPVTTVGALRAVHLPASTTAVRVGAAVETVVAVAAAITGAPVLALAVGVSYLAFAGFVGLALARRTPVGTCGCFGRVDTPPSVGHVLLNLAAAASAVVVAAGPGGDLVATLTDQPLAGVPFLLLVAVGAFAAYAVLTIVPRLAARRVSR